MAAAAAAAAVNRAPNAFELPHTAPAAAPLAASQGQQSGTAGSLVPVGEVVGVVRAVLARLPGWQHTSRQQRQQLHAAMQELSELQGDVMLLPQFWLDYQVGTGRENGGLPSM